MFRHPNVVEPWTGRLYSTLGAPASQGSEGQRAIELRLIALLVLTHLVLNDMLKPRAVLLVRALWLTACTHEPTARVARILFQELSKRSTNVVYNLLPEIIARLPEHSGQSGKVEGGAEERVKYVMQFVEKEKHIEGLIEKLTVRLEQAANLTGGTSTAATQATGDFEDGESAPTRAKETVSCLSNALGAMNYTDRCILRLHDAVIVRKALNTAISYHEVTRESLLCVVERARRPKPGKEKAGEGAPPAEGGGAAEAPAEGGEKKGGVSAAAAAALDAIEQMIHKLGKGQEDAEQKDDQKEEVKGEKEEEATKEELDDEEDAPTLPVKTGGKGRGKAANKRKAEPVDEPGCEEEEAPAAKKGAGRGRGRGRGRGAAEAKPAGRGAASAGAKKRRARADDDGDED